MNKCSKFVCFAITCILWCQVVSAQQVWPQNIPYPYDFPQLPSNNVTIKATSTAGTATYFNPSTQVLLEYFWEESFTTNSSSAGSTNSSDSLRLRRKWNNSNLVESKGYRDQSNTNQSAGFQGGDWVKTTYAHQTYVNEQGAPFTIEELKFTVAYKSFFNTTAPLRKARFTSIATDFPIQTSHKPASYKIPREEADYEFENLAASTSWRVKRSFLSKDFADGATQNLSDSPSGDFPNSGGTGKQILVALIKPRLFHFFPMEMMFAEEDPFKADSFLPDYFPPDQFSTVSWDWSTATVFQP